MKRDERQKEKAGDTASLFQTGNRPGLAPWLEVATAGWWKGDQFEGAVMGHGREYLGRERASSAEMAQRRAPAVAVETPSGSNFVLSPHSAEYLDSESE